ICESEGTVRFIREGECLLKETTSENENAELDVCGLDSDRGSFCGKRWTKKYYYDKEFKRCKLFWYGGCDGNGNNFDDEAACEAKCLQSKTDCSSIECNGVGETCSMATGAPECVCNIICTFDYNPVCGQEGTRKKTYGNRCALDSAICKSKGEIRFVSNGACPSYEAVKQDDNKPKCNQICTFDYTPVCGYDGTKYKTYGNQCALDA
ncbi:unnamed protein product, partial [Owenia fusiformis]